MTKVLTSGTYIGGKFYDAGLSASELPDDVVKQIGDHLWGKPSEVGAPAGDESTDIYAALSAARARIEELEAEVSGLKAELEAARTDAAQSQIDGSGSTDTGQTPGGAGAVELPENLDRLKKDELKALASERGVEVAEDDTNAQIVEKLKAAASGSGS